MNRSPWRYWMLLTGTIVGVTRTLGVISGLVARVRREGQTVDLLVDRSSPQDVLLNEPGEPWFLPMMFIVIGAICTIGFALAWWSGEMGRAWS